jgi:hypothetical protein
MNQKSIYIIHSHLATASDILLMMDGTISQFVLGTKLFPQTAHRLS